MIYISYFYNIRFFPNNLVPISTAVWDPKWYHDGQGKDYSFIDKRGVVNGLRCEFLSPASIYDESTDCRKNCNKNPDTCEFLSKYYDYLHTLDFNKVEKILTVAAEQIHPDGADVCLIVYEKPDNPCSERVVLRQWFEENERQLPEWLPS